MTHTLHRRGSQESLEKDFVVLGIASADGNRKGAAPLLGKVLEIMQKHHPTNYGDMGAGNQFTVSSEELISQTKDNAIVHGVYRSEEDLVSVLKELQEADTGMSIVVSGLFDHVRQCCKETGMHPHTINASLGIFGNLERLPSEETMEVSTMCGHGMISYPLILDRVKKIQQRRMSAEDAAKNLARNCHCGVFNWERAARILIKMAEKRE